MGPPFKSWWGEKKVSSLVFESQSHDHQFVIMQKLSMRELVHHFWLSIRLNNLIAGYKSN